MRAHQIMSRNVVTVLPETSILEAAQKMLENRVSGLPVLDPSGNLVGIVSEKDFLRRSEIGTVQRTSRWLQYFLGPGHSADDFVRERGRKVKDIMTRDPIVADADTPLEELVRLMETNGIKRLPVLNNGKLAGIVTRANLVRAVAGMAREIPDPTANDDNIRERIIRTIDATDWRPTGLQVGVRDGIVHLHGLVFNDNSRRASIVAAENTAGVKEVHDHLCYVDTWSGFYLESPEDLKKAAG